MDFNERLRRVIDKSGDTIIGVSKVCGVAKNTLHNYLNGSQPPKAQFLERLKENYPWVNLNWLIAGDGEPFVFADSEKTDKVLDFRLKKVFREFGNREYVIELNQALVVLEKTSLKDFFEVGGYIKGLVKQEIHPHPDRRRGQRRQNSGPYAGEERRSGQDRRKAAGEG